MRVIKKSRGNNSMRILICILSLMALMSATAFAAAGDNLLTDGKTPVEAVKTESGEFMLVEGTVGSVTVQDGAYTISIDNDDMGMVFHVQDGVFVIDQETGENKTVGDIAKDMEIAAVIAKNSPMTMSIPPQTPGAAGFVIKSEAGSVDLSVYNEELVNAENTLKLNASDTTKIARMNGNKMLYKADSLAGSECLVLYTASTRSIPAQTTPEYVMLLNTADELAETGTPSEAAEGRQTGAETVYMELREGAEAKGYEVKWTSNNAPIVLTKGDITVEITIGSDAFTISHMTLDLQPLDEMEKLSLPAKLENGTTMVPSDFIEALK